MRKCVLGLLLAGLSAEYDLKAQTCHRPGKERWPVKTSVPGKEPSNTSSVKIRPVRVTVTEQLFCDDAHRKDNGEKELRGQQHMNSHTLWELHPITDFRIVKPAGCQF